jgi:hypothetical protein
MTAGGSWDVSATALLRPHSCSARRDTDSPIFSLVPSPGLGFDRIPAPMTTWARP